MKSYDKLMRWLLRWSWQYLACAAAVLVLWDLIAVLSVGGAVENAYLSYDQVLQAAHLEYPFVLAVTLACVLLALRYYSLVEEDGVKPVYGMMSLPAPRWALPAAELGVAALFVLALFALQNLTALACYPAWRHAAAEAAAQFPAYAGNLAAAETVTGPFPPVGQADGLYLAFVRTPLLRVTLPGTLLELATSAALAVLLAGCTAYGASHGSRFGLLFTVLIPAVTYGVCVQAAAVAEFFWSLLPVPVLLLLWAAWLSASTVLRYVRTFNLP